MTVTMVHIVHDTTVSYSHGLAALAGSLGERSDGDVSLVTIRDQNVQQATTEILATEPSVVLFSCMSNQWRMATQIAASLRGHCEVPLVVGGSHVEAAPATVMKSPFHLGVKGEGEGLIRDLVHPGRIAEIMKGSSPIIYGHAAEVLDDLPRPRLDIFAKQDILEYPSVMFSRGCPYKCAYCMSRRGGITGTIRWKSPSRAIEEVRDLIEYARPAEIYIDDDTFLKKPKWVKSFCAEYRQEFAEPFFCNARPETVKESVITELAAAGCRAIGIGIESGSERIRREVLDRPMSDEVIERAFRMAHDAGLETWSFNMVGIPGETDDDLRATIAINERVATHFVRVSIFTAYPGTPFFTSDDRGYARGYFRSADTLAPSARQLYLGWLADLDSDGRLWFTETERDLVTD